MHMSGSSKSKAAPGRRMNQEERLTPARAGRDTLRGLSHSTQAGPGGGRDTVYGQFSDYQAR